MKATPSLWGHTLTFVNKPNAFSWIVPDCCISKTTCYAGSLMILEQLSNLKYKYGNRRFWCRGYYVSTVRANKKRQG